jgi:hypothetical protein
LLEVVQIYEHKEKILELDHTNVALHCFGTRLPHMPLVALTRSHHERAKPVPLRVTKPQDASTRDLNIRRVDCGKKEVAMATAAAASKIATGAVSIVDVAAGDVTSKVVASAITASKSATSAVFTAAVAAGAVTTSQVAASAITASKIATSAVSTADVAASAVTSSKIATSAVSTADVAASAITSSKIATNAVSTADVAASAITAAAGTESKVTVASWITDALGKTTNIVPVNKPNGSTFRACAVPMGNALAYAKGELKYAPNLYLMSDTATTCFDSTLIRQKNALDSKYYRAWLVYAVAEESQWKEYHARFQALKTQSEARAKELTALKGESSNNYEFYTAAAAKIEKASTGNCGEMCCVFVVALAKAQPQVPTQVVQLSCERGSHVFVVVNFSQRLARANLNELKTRQDVYFVDPWTGEFATAKKLLSGEEQVVEPCYMRFYLVNLAHMCEFCVEWFYVGFAGKNRHV